MPHSELKILVKKLGVICAHMVDLEGPVTYVHIMLPHGIHIVTLHIWYHLLAD